MAVEGKEQIFTPIRNSKNDLLDMADYGLELIRSMRKMTEDKAETEPEFFRLAYPQIEKLREDIMERTISMAFFNEDTVTFCHENIEIFSSALIC